MLTNLEVTNHLALQAFTLLKSGKFDDDFGFQPEPEPPHKYWQGKSQLVQKQKNPGESKGISVTREEHHFSTNEVAETFDLVSVSRLN